MREKAEHDLCRVKQLTKIALSRIASRWLRLGGPFPRADRRGGVMHACGTAAASVTR
jgi:hypothetical protein